jgi:hypothetical protein
MATWLVIGTPFGAMLLLAIFLGRGRNLQGRDGQRADLDEARWRKDVAAADAFRMAYARTPPYQWLSRLGR